MNPEIHDGDDWNTNRRHVMAEIGRQGKAIDDVEKKQDQFTLALTDVRLEMMNLKFRQTVWGVLAASLPSALMAVVWYIAQQRH